MAEETQEQKILLEPKVDLQQVGPCKLKVSFEVAIDKVRQVVDDKYAKLNEAVQLPGFRKGHAPRSLLERKFGKEISSDVKHMLIENSVREAIDAKKFEPLIEPKLLDEDQVQFKADAPFTFAVEVEVRPNIEIKSYTGLKVKRPKVEVTDADIARQLERHREAKAEWEPVEEAAKEGDQVIQDMELVTDGNVVMSEENVALALHDKISLLNAPIPEYYKAIVGHKAGDTVEYTTKLPKETEDPKLADKEVVVRSKIKSVKRKKLPELNDDLAKSLDLDSLDQLREEIKKFLMRQKEEDAKGDMYAQILTELAAQNDFPLPEGLVQKWASEHLQRLEVDMINRGTPQDVVQAELEKNKDKAQEQATLSLKQHLIIEHIASKEKIFVTEDEVDRRIEEIAARQGRWPTEVRNYLEQNDMLRALRGLMRTEKVLEYLLSKAVLE